MSFKIPKRGYLYVAFAALLWAVSGTSGKYLFQQGMTPYELVQIRLTLSVVSLGTYFSLRKSHLLRISSRDILYFAILGTLGMGMVQFTYFYTISKIPVASAILLEYLAPSFIALYNITVLKERPNFFVILALLGATLGCYLVVGAYNLDLLSMNKYGIVSGIGSAISFAWYSVYGERGMRRYHPWTVLFYALLFACLLWNVIYPPLKAFDRQFSLIDGILILYIAIFGTVIPFGLYLQGINLIRASRASITATLEPITAAAISWLFLGESLEVAQITGGILVVLSVIILQFRKEEDPSTPEIVRSKRAQSHE
ncbi:MAG: EamA family transporter [Syntrophobacterales bacterium]|nr:EamA family transporter [Syntrophobacterales bacterium]